jgi:HPt (histidine-containing phosphotransfer) domain-containing protein
MPEQEAADPLAQLRRAYHSQLPARLEQIESARAEGEADGWRTLHRLVHKLAGSAACYSYVGLSERASAAEAHLQAMLDGQAGDDALTRLESLLRELRAAFAAVSRRPPV